MGAAYTAVTVLAAIAFGTAAGMNFVRHRVVVEAADRVRVSHSWMYPLGSLLAAGAVGLLAGFVVPALGTAAAIGLVVYFLCAVGAHLRVGDLEIVNALVFLSMAVAALVLGLLHRGLT